MTLPLDGITVLDLSRVLSGPFATQQLFDLGAEIIKVEQPSTGDDTRAFGPPFLGGESTYFMSINRGKKSIAIDLKQPHGRDLTKALATKVDVVIENFRPGTADRLGIGMAALHAENPSLICCSISGYGTDGAAAFEGRAGYDAVIQAASGLMSLTGPVDGPPSRVGVAIADLVAGLFAAQGILAALFERARTGRGRHIEISMQEAMVSLLTYQAGIYFATGDSPKRMGDAHPSICPYESVKTADGLLMLAVGNDDQFRRFSACIGRAELADDPRFRENRARVESRAALLQILGPILETKTTHEWDMFFAKAGVPAGPVLDVKAAIEHPQIQARGLVLEHHHPVAGRVFSLQNPVRLMDEARANNAPPAPLLGEHTQEVLAQKLGIKRDEILALERDGVVSSRSRAPN